MHHARRTSCIWTCHGLGSPSECADPALSSYLVRLRRHRRHRWMTPVSVVAWGGRCPSGVSPLAVCVCVWGVVYPGGALRPAVSAAAPWCGRPAPRKQDCTLLPLAPQRRRRRLRPRQRGSCLRRLFQRFVTSTFAAPADDRLSVGRRGLHPCPRSCATIVHSVVVACIRPPRSVTACDGRAWGCGAQGRLLLGQRWP